MYDYENHQENNNHYGQVIEHLYYTNSLRFIQSTPPIYDIHKVNAPTYLYWGTEDWLGDPTDVREHILPGIPTQYLAGNFLLNDFNHVDFIWGERAPAEIYQPMIEIMKQDLRGTNKCF